MRSKRENTSDDSSEMESNEVIENNTPVSSSGKHNTPVSDNVKTLDKKDLQGLKCRESGEYAIQ
jgi:hypothetical protein